MISDEKFKEIIGHVDIVDLVQGYGIKLEKAGKGYRGLCPFHDDNSPSFNISTEKKIAKCMSCGEGGNPITFVSKIESISFIEAAKKVADKYGVKLDVTIKTKETNKYAKYYEITNFALKFYQNFLGKSINKNQALNYLHNRRLDDETIKRFGIGLSPNSHDSLLKTLVDANFLKEDIQLVGLAKGDYDQFRNRIMFPIFDELSNVVGFSGRKYLKENENEPKYINSPETILFKKSDLLYNLNNARIEVKKKNRLILFEGFMDVIASYNAGIKEGICSMGTALTANQAAKIKKLTNNIVICYDGDNAGIQATKKAISILSKQNLNIQILSLKEGLDPDEYIGKYGKEAYCEEFSKNLLDSLGFTYNLEKQTHNLDNYKEAEEFKTNIFSLIKQTNSNTIIDRYCTKLSADLNVSIDAINKDYNIYCTPVYKEKIVEIPIKNKKNKIETKYLKAEKMLLKHMTHSKLIAAQIKDDVLPHPFIDEMNQRLWVQLMDGYYKKLDFFDEPVFEAMFEEEDLKEYYQFVIKPILIANDDKMEEEINQLENTIKKYGIEISIRNKKDEIKATQDEIRKLELLDEVCVLEKKLKQ